MTLWLVLVVLRLVGAVAVVVYVWRFADHVVDRWRR